MDDNGPRKSMLCIEVHVVEWVIDRPLSIVQDDEDDEFLKANDNNEGNTKHHK